jgi:hypothetical protein
MDIDDEAKLKMKDLRQICTQNSDVPLLYTVHYTVQIYRLYRVLEGPGKFLRLISHWLSNKVYNLNVYT